MQRCGAQKRRLSVYGLTGNWDAVNCVMCHCGRPSLCAWRHLLRGGHRVYGGCDGRSSVCRCACLWPVLSGPHQKHITPVSGPLVARYRALSSHGNTIVWMWLCVHMLEQLLHCLLCEANESYWEEHTNHEVVWFARPSCKLPFTLTGRLRDSVASQTSHGCTFPLGVWTLFSVSVFSPETGFRRVHCISLVDIGIETSKHEYWCVAVHFLSCWWFSLVLLTPHDYSGTFQGGYSARFTALRRVLEGARRALCAAVCVNGGCMCYVVYVWREAVCAVQCVEGGCMCCTVCVEGGCMCCTVCGGRLYVLYSVCGGRL